MYRVELMIKASDRQGQQEPVRRAYERPALKELGSMGDVTQKSGSVPDQPPDGTFFNF